MEVVVKIGLDQDTKTTIANVIEDGGAFAYENVVDERCDGFVGDASNDRILRIIRDGIWECSFVWLVVGS
jgi:hypothetical protein